MFISGIPKRNLLEFAEKIGGKKMYFGLKKAISEAGVSETQELNERQLENVLDKFSKNPDFGITKTGMKKLIGERERRRQAYIKMAIEGEAPERGERYDYKKINLPSNVRSSVSSGKGAASSISSLKGPRTSRVATTSIFRKK